MGDVIKVSVKDAIPRGKVKKGEVYDAVVVRTRARRAPPDGSLIRFDGNAAVLLTNKLEPIGTRIFGPVTRELRNAAVHEDHLARARSAMMQREHRESRYAKSKGDDVVVIAGRDKGRAWRRHQSARRRPRAGRERQHGEEASARQPAEQTSAGRHHREAKRRWQISKVALWNAGRQEGRPHRHSIRSADGKRVRFFKSNREKSSTPEGAASESWQQDFNKIYRDTIVPELQERPRAREH